MSEEELKAANDEQVVNKKDTSEPQTAGSQRAVDSLEVEREIKPMNYLKARHPSRSLEMRRKGYGIGAGYEGLYQEDTKERSDKDDEPYGPLSQCGYYGGGTGARRFEIGQAGFRDELNWYRKQYGDKTSKYQDEK